MVVEAGFIESFNTTIFELASGNDWFAGKKHKHHQFPRALLTSIRALANTDRVTLGCHQDALDF